MQSGGEKYLFPTDSEAVSAAEEMVKELKAKQMAESQNPTRVGTLGKWHLSLVEHSASLINNRNPNVRGLDLTFGGVELDAIITDGLGNTRAQLKYPMLFRLRDPFEDVVFERFEIQSLRQECLHARNVLKSNKALSGLAKLILASDEALKSSMALYFESD